MEIHYATSMTRPGTTTTTGGGGDSENYQQCNYQSFQMLVHSAVDQSNCKRMTDLYIILDFSLF